MNTKTIGSIALVLVLLVAGFFGYQAYFSDEPVVETQGSGATEAGQKILTLLQSLEGIELNGQIFSNPDFLSLVDPSVRIESQLQGRPNPFDLIGQDDLSQLENPDQMARDSRAPVPEPEDDSDSANDVGANDVSTTTEESQSGSDQTTQTETTQSSEADTSTSNQSSQSEASGETEQSSSASQDTSNDTEGGSFGGGSDGPPPPPAVPAR